MPVHQAPVNCWHAVGVIGWHARMWGREGAWGLCGFVLAALGLTLGVAGMTGSALGVVGSRTAARVINTGEHAGLVLIGQTAITTGTKLQPPRVLCFSVAIPHASMPAA